MSDETPFVHCFHHEREFFFGPPQDVDAARGA